ncbi:MAG: SpoIIIAH-like family protein [Halanaerobiales bacterium]|nr:SpoIIIAH-like family protein [Halanaerobiales bacterium]
MENETKRRLVWFAVFMVWIGAIYAIWQGQSSKEIPTQSNSPKQTQVSIHSINEQEIEKTQNIQLSKVKEENPNKDFFIRYRLDRDKVRSEQINYLREMINNPNTDPEKKKEAQDMMLNLTKQIEEVMKAESLIRARGYYDALVFIHENAVDVIVQSNGLTVNDVAKISDIVVRCTNYREEDINIMEKRIDKN